MEQLHQVERIRIVEDEEPTRIGLAELVRSWGFLAEEAAGGEERNQDLAGSGVVRTSAPGPQPTGGGLWRVRVLSGEGARRFAKLVGFVSDTKSRLLETALDVAEEEPEGFDASWFFPHVDAELDLLGFRLGAELRAAIGSYRHGAHPYGMSLARAAGIQAAFPAELEGPLARFAQGEELYVPVTVEPAGPGDFKGKRPIEFRVLVVPQCYCADDDPSDCAAADAVMAGDDPWVLEPSPLRGLRLGIAQGLPLRDLDQTVSARFNAATQALNRAGAVLSDEARVDRRDDAAQRRVADHDLEPAGRVRHPGRTVACAEPAVAGARHLRAALRHGHTPPAVTQPGTGTARILRARCARVTSESPAGGSGSY